MGGEMEVVPFGKYKGRPVYDLVADDSYCEWLAAQPWFRQRYGTVYNLIINQRGEPQDTPEHNALQARFLDHDECLRLQYGLKGTLTGWWERNWADKLRPEQRENLRPGAETIRIGRLAFEEHGWDVDVTTHGEMTIEELGAERECVCQCDPTRCRTAGTKSPDTHQEWSTCFDQWEHRASPVAPRRVHCTDGCPSGWIGEGDHFYLRARQQQLLWLTTAIELKPSIGDDYPTVLRDVLKRMKLEPRRWSSNDLAVVLAERVETSVGVSLEQVRKIFRSQRVRLLLLDELPNSVPDSWHCSCETCAD